MKVPQTPPRLDRLMDEVTSDLLVRLVTEVRPVDYQGRYLHWDELRNRTPPVGLTREQWWLGTVLARHNSARSLPVTGTDGRSFRFCNVDLVQELVHRIDQQASGQILADDVVTNLRSSNRYLVSSLAEEAITSNQLEGASTSRKVAKELLETGRKPRDRSEQMIVNNYQAMQYAQELSGQPLTPTAVLDLHRIVTDSALDDPDEAGRLQTPEDDRIAVYWHDGTLLHRPPNATELRDRLAAMCRFANGEATEGFIHPVVRAVIVHFWLAYDHPFADGNGRTARALFYRCMLNSGYWLTQYLSVSTILRKAPAKYVRSYLFAETDELDITYFVLYHLEVILRSIDGLIDYLARKIAETRELEGLIRGSSRLNHRQLRVVGDALRDPTEPFTIHAQVRRNRVTYQTARTDLLSLESLGLFSK